MVFASPNNLWLFFPLNENATNPACFGRVSSPFRSTVLPVIVIVLVLVAVLVCDK
jgi:hypothetical protein